MDTWTKDEPSKIENADELQIAPRRPDGKLLKPRTIWVVRRGDNLYVRSVNGPTSGWFRGTRYGRSGPDFVAQMTTAPARGTTIQLVPAGS